ncbi:MAG: hypothetical protein BROFUL_00347 [Candidatus Brocadia fulgida]|jgi:hypothetical protein|uniref:Uncharacterized protein n=1 Tax=Candidatus Brocadia fulgida TaxID=380242 RepID=A0A0M2V2I5_9BACT|nr:MAG: hypothetical protein BROFUL_00347 [Candidatus Brocadia fulgida]
MSGNIRVSFITQIKKSIQQNKGFAGYLPYSDLGNKKSLWKKDI